MKKCNANLLPPGFFGLCNNGRVGVTHHGDEDVDHHDWHDEHVKNKKSFCKWFIIGASKFLILQLFKMCGNLIITRNLHHNHPYSHETM